MDVLEYLRELKMEDISSDRLQRQVEIKRNSLLKIKNYDPTTLSDNTEEYEVRIWKPDVIRLCNEQKRRFMDELEALEQLEQKLERIYQREVIAFLPSMNI